MKLRSALKPGLIGGIVVIYLSAIWFKTWRGGFDKDFNYNEIEIAGLFWHFVDLVWILVFTFVYLMGAMR